MPATALIVTLQMDAVAAAHFTRLRRMHFPPERNWLDAHVTLFHALPLDSRERVLADIAEIAAATEAFSVRVDRIHFLGAGVAYALVSERASEVRGELARRWHDLLGRQDRSWRGPLHVTVQNKVHHLAARDLQVALARDFEPYEIRAVGLQVWEYVGGPWSPVASLGFSQPVPPGG